MLLKVRNITQEDKWVWGKIEAGRVGLARCREEPQDIVILNYYLSNTKLAVSYVT